LDELSDKIKQHTMGSGFKHNSFDDLIIYKNDSNLSKEFIETWVSPFYLNIGHTDKEFFEQLKRIKTNLTKEIALQLLGDLNWRTRQSGAFFTAINNYTELIDIIGIHFLKSEVTYAGKVYALVLAYFNNKQTIKYLKNYLDFYLLRPAMWFDQRDAMEALLYLDEENKTTFVDVYSNAWKKFIENKPDWGDDLNSERIRNQVKFIRNLQD